MTEGFVTSNLFERILFHQKVMTTGVAVNWKINLTRTLYKLCVKQIAKTW